VCHDEEATWIDSGIALYPPPPRKTPAVHTLLRPCSNCPLSPPLFFGQSVRQASISESNCRSSLASSALPSPATRASSSAASTKPSELCGYGNAQRIRFCRGSHNVRTKRETHGHTKHMHSERLHKCRALSSQSFVSSDHERLNRPRHCGRRAT